MSSDAERLRHVVARLARLLRQQDEGQLGATASSALASVNNRGPMTLGELAASEQVAPPTMTIGLQLHCSERVVFVVAERE